MRNFCSVFVCEPLSYIAVPIHRLALEVMTTRLAALAAGAEPNAWCVKYAERTHALWHNPTGAYTDLIGSPPAENHCHTVPKIVSSTAHHKGCRRALLIDCCPGSAVVVVCSRRSLLTIKTTLYAVGFQPCSWSLPGTLWSLGMTRASYTAMTASRLRSVKSPFRPMKWTFVSDAPRLRGMCMSRLCTPLNRVTWTANRQRLSQTLQTGCFRVCQRVKRLRGPQICGYIASGVEPCQPSFLAASKCR